MTNEIIEFYREHLKPIIQKMLLKTNYQGQGKVDYEEFGRDFDELLDLAIIGMQSNSDEDCISRAEAINAIEEYGSVWMEYTEEMSIHQIAERALKASKQSMYKILHDLPSVQPKPKTGHWINIEDKTDWYDATYKCSCCGREIITPYELKNNLYSDYPYCHCGAKMESENKE